MSSKGICSSCRKEKNCTYPQEYLDSVLECGDFQPFDKSVPNPFKGQPAHKVEHKKGYTGLCGDCAVVETCCFNKPDGGVWSCEQFRPAVSMH